MSQDSQPGGRLGPYSSLATLLQLFVIGRDIAATSIVIATSGVVSIVLQQRRWRARLHELRHTVLLPSLFLQAESRRELGTWLNTDEDLLKTDVAQLRSLCRFLFSPSEYQAGHHIFGAPLFKSMEGKHPAKHRRALWQWELFKPMERRGLGNAMKILVRELLSTKPLSAASSANRSTTLIGLTGGKLR